MNSTHLWISALAAPPHTLLPWRRLHHSSFHVRSPEPVGRSRHSLQPIRGQVSPVMTVPNTDATLSKSAAFVQP